jgi:hypothetical protein
MVDPIYRPVETAPPRTPKPRPALHPRCLRLGLRRRRGIKIQLRFLVSRGTYSICGMSTVHGNDGRKAAHRFSHEEKGRCCFKYSRRLPFWELMSHLTETRGHSDLSAVELIKQCYGDNISVTQICKALAVARRTGNFHPNLGYNPQQGRRGSRHYPQQQANQVGQQILMNV